LPIELTNADNRNSDVYKEYYAVATEATPLKTKDSVRKTRSSSDTTVTPPTAAAGPRLSTSVKGKQPATTSKAKRVLDVPTDESDEEISWKSNDEEGDDDVDEEGDDGEEGHDDDNDQEDEGNDEDDQGEEMRDEESFDPIPKTPKNTDDEGNGEENLGMNVSREEGQDEEDEKDELYRDVNINLGRGSASVSSQFMASMLNPKPDAGIESIFETTSQMDIQTSTLLAPLPMPAPTLTPSTIATVTTTQQAPTPPTTAPSTLLQDLPNFVSLFGFNHRLKTLEANFSEFMQTNQFAGVISSILRIKNDEFLKTIDENMQKIIKEQVKVQVSKILPKIEQTVNEKLEAEVLTWSSNSSKTSYAVVADLSEMELKKILIEKMEGNKSIHRSNEQRNLYKALVEAYESVKIILDTYRDTVTLKRHHDDDADRDEEPFVGSDWGSADKPTQGSKSRQTSESESATAEEPMQTTYKMEEPSHPEFETGADDQPIIESSQHPECELAKQSDSRSSFNELMDTPVDFSAFLMNRLKVNTFTPELLACPTYELMKGSCKSLVELEFFLEEVYKATINQIDWVNPEGQQYPHNMLKPLPLIPNSRGRHVIPFDHFINNDLDYLRGVCRDDDKLYKFKEGDFKRLRIQNIEDIIIAVSELKIVEWHNYKHLDWITVRRDDDKLYKFKEGDFKRLRIQNIEDMLLLLVQGKLTNLTVEERFGFNNRDKQNRLMRIDELHKFSDGMLTDARTILDDRLKGIQMKYLPQTISRKSDKDRRQP
nr:hypothetical protein [Tanacetum cinerariifolium]